MESIWKNPFERKREDKKRSLNAGKKKLLIEEFDHGTQMHFETVPSERANVWEHMKSLFTAVTLDVLAKKT